MKKTFVLLLTLVMVFSLCAPALAADTIESVPGTSTGTVSVAYTEGVNDKIVYSVTVDWTDLSMEYQTEGEGTWNPTSHEYEGETVDEWKDNEASVTVTNHSNAGVTASIAAGDSNVLTYSFNKDSFDLATAENTTTENAPSDTFTITAETVPTKELSETFTVTITAAKEYDHTVSITKSYTTAADAATSESILTVKPGESIYMTLDGYTLIVGTSAATLNGSYFANVDKEAIYSASGPIEAMVFTIGDTTETAVLLGICDRVDSKDTTYWCKVTIEQ